MYPEYVDVWNRAVAGYRSVFASGSAAYAAAQRYAQATGMKLLNRTPFSDTDAIGVTFNYSVAKNLATIADLRKVAPTLTLGAPPQFQQGPDGLLAVEAAYGFTPAAFKPLEIGEQYQALDRDVVQAADVNTTDAQLVTGNYTLLRDPRHVFGWGNVAPVVPRKVLLAEGPAFERTIDKVSALLTDGVMRQLNAAVDLGQQDPAMVARRFLLAHGLLSSG
jgi:osmoprotectant transport system substrate-binding protein